MREDINKLEIRILKKQIEIAELMAERFVLIDASEYELASKNKDQERLLKKDLIQLRDELLNIPVTSNTFLDSLEYRHFLKVRNFVDAQINANAQLTYEIDSRINNLSKEASLIPKERCDELSKAEESIISERNLLNSINFHSYAGSYHNAETAK